jgi:hypothetical protein
VVLISNFSLNGNLEIQHKFLKERKRETKQEIKKERKRKDCSSLRLYVMTGFEKRERKRERGRKGEREP